MKLTKTFLFLIFVVFLLTISACSKSNNTTSGNQNAVVSGQVTQDINDLGNEINQTQQLSDDLASPNLDLDVNF